MTHLDGRGDPGAGLAIRAEGLAKSFGTLRAVDGIDLEVPRGEIFAILGPNGAGKTTFMRMLATLLAPDGGRATVMGHDLISEPQKVRASIAMTGQFASLEEDLTGRENLILLARLWGFRGASARDRADALLADFDLSDAARRQVKNYSGGMRRRLDIAASLVVTPGVLFLDEPTTGLPPCASSSPGPPVQGKSHSRWRCPWRSPCSSRRSSSGSTGGGEATSRVVFAPPACHLTHTSR